MVVVVCPRLRSAQGGSGWLPHSPKHLPRCSQASASPWSRYPTPCARYRDDKGCPPSPPLRSNISRQDPRGPYWVRRCVTPPPTRRCPGTRDDGMTVLVPRFHPYPCREPRGGTTVTAQCARTPQSRCGLTARGMSPHSCDQETFSAPIPSFDTHMLTPLPRRPAAARRPRASHAQAPRSPIPPRTASPAPRLPYKGDG